MIVALKNALGCENRYWCILLMMHDRGLFDEEGVLANGRDVYDYGCDENKNSYNTILSGDKNYFNV